MRDPDKFSAILVGAALLLSALAPVCATEYFVKTNGSDGAAGTNWATAFLTISNAVDKTTDGDTVTVSNGTYNVDTNIYITNGITVQSLNGTTNTFVNATTNSYSCFRLNHANAVVDGFTITNGNYSWGAGVRLIAGTLRNCTVSGNTASSGGGGIYMTDGIVSNCLFVGNSAIRGGGVRCDGGTVINCTIRNNSVSGVLLGGGVYLNSPGAILNCIITNNQSAGGLGGGMMIFTGGTVRSCLIADNTASHGGGIYMNSGGDVENCTIVNNTATGGTPKGGGVRILAGTIENTIIYFNTSSTGPNWSQSGGTVSYSCTTPDIGGTANITNDPRFVDFATQNYRLTARSQCINVGTNMAWMSTAVDLDGSDRILHDVVDMGAYETLVPPRRTLFTIY